jgi:ribonuclease III
MGGLESAMGLDFRDKGLLELALTHRSHAHWQGGGATGSFERLEFLGDAVLQMVVTDYLYGSDPEASEGDLTKARAWLVNDAALARAAGETGLGEHILLSPSAESDGARGKDFILADALEALIGAVYLDRGLEEARKLVERVLGGRMREAVSQGARSDYKTMLQEWSIKARGLLPSYRGWDEGPDHSKLFHAEAWLGDEMAGGGVGRSKKEAEQEAARAACSRMREMLDLRKGECELVGTIGIVTDSTAYLDEAYIREHDIKVVPLKVIFGNDSYREGMDLTHEEFFRKLKEFDGFPTTSQPSVGEFSEAYREMAGKYEQVLSVHISGGISGTMESARAAAAELPDTRIEVVDSMSTSMGIYMLIEEAIRMMGDGADLDAILARLGSIIEDSKVYFAVDTLEYLHKGGRIGGAQAFLGSVLKIKPILTIHGTIDAKEKARGTQKAVARTVELAQESLGGRKPVLGVTHIFDEQAGQALKKLVQEAFDCEASSILVNETGPVIGSHTGPGTVGLFFYPAG